MTANAKPPKNIVICCDGTGNKFNADNSNVVKLYTCLRIDEEQIGYYHPGVGTMGDSTRPTWLGKQISVIKGLAFASGFQANLGDAYKYLMDKYADGDRIYLFGFSRGAYTVRALAGMLYMYGLLCPGNDGHLPYVLRMFSEESKRAFKQQDEANEGLEGTKHGHNKLNVDETARAFRETFSRRVPIHFLGLWDTVSSIGWVYDPVKLLFDGQNPIVRRARHAVSADERRCFYQANLLGPPLPDTETLADLETGDPVKQDILQVWFSGVHSDVGGSYPQKESGPATDALKWMLEESKDAGLCLQREKLKAVLGDELGDAFKLPVGAKVDCEAIRRLNKAAPKGQRLHHSLTAAWWPLEIFPHKYFDQAGKARLRIAPWPHWRELPDGALLHPTLVKRLMSKDPSGNEYKPANPLKAGVTEYMPNLGDHLMPEVREKLVREHYGSYRAKSGTGLPMGASLAHAASAPGAVRAGDSDLAGSTVYENDGGAVGTGSAETTGANVTTGITTTTWTAEVTGATPARPPVKEVGSPMENSRHSGHS